MLELRQQEVLQKTLSDSFKAASVKTSTPLQSSSDNLEKFLLALKVIPKYLKNFLSSKIGINSHGMAKKRFVVHNKLSLGVNFVNIAGRFFSFNFRPYP